MARSFFPLLVLCAVIFPCCKTTPTYMSHHAIVGTWEYQAGDLHCTRRFAPNGVVTLTIDGNVVWSVAWHAVSDTEVVAVMENGRLLHHELLSTGRLNIQDLYLAVRRSH